MATAHVFVESCVSFPLLEVLNITSQQQGLMSYLVDPFKSTTPVGPVTHPGQHLMFRT